ncbi:MAG: serine/threonine-protein kinase [Myxococcota bacterium]
MAGSSEHDHSEAEATGLDALHTLKPSDRATIAGDGDASDRPALEPDAPRLLDRYVVQGTLGRGGMGTVLRGFDPQLDRRVALKLLHHEVDTADTSRLRREAQAMAKLSHPNVVQVYEVGHVEGRTYVAMELVNGRTLEQVVRTEPPVPWPRALDLYLQAGRGLAAAHEVGLVHRDFKPSNAMVDEHGRVRVLDFGVVRAVDDDGSDVDPSSEEPPPDGQEPTTLTRTGALMGTPAYMALEQHQRGKAEARSDQFSFCVALYEALYGQRPHPGQTMGERLAAMVDERVAPAPPGTPVPRPLRRVLLRGLANAPDRRWPSMNALLSALQSVVDRRRRRRWTMMGLGVGVLAVAGGWSANAYLDPEQQCSGATVQLRGVWDEEQRTATREAFLATDVPYAAELWPRIDAGIDDYVSSWSGMYTEACAATTIRGEQTPETMELRMSCLRNRRVALEQTVRVLGHAQPKVIEKSMNLVMKLPSLEHCDNIEALHAELPPPDDPATAFEVEAVRERLESARALAAAGMYDQAKPISEVAARRAEELGYLPLLAEALRRRGRARYSAGRFEDARADLERSYAVALEAGYAAAARAAAESLTWIVGYDLANHDAGLQWSITALATARGPHGDRAHEADALMGIGALRLEQGQQDESLEQFRHALEIREEISGPDSFAVASALESIGNALGHRGDYEDALEHQERALSIYIDHLGPQHPSIAVALGNIGANLADLGRLEESMQYQRQALEIRERAFGPEHPAVSYSLSNLAVVQHQRGNLVESVALHRRALAIREKTYGADHAQVGYSLNGLANALSELGRTDEAFAPYERALGIFERTHGPEHPHVASVLDGLGVVHGMRGDSDKALEALRRALAIKQEALGPEHARVGNTLHELGKQLRQHGDLEASREHEERSLAVFDQSLGPDHPRLVGPLVILSELEFERGRVVVARQYAERAMALSERGEVPPVEFAQVRLALAQALWSDPAERARARTLAERAAATEDDAADRLRARATAWLQGHPLP